MRLRSGVVLFYSKNEVPIRKHGAQAAGSGALLMFSVVAVWGRPADAPALASTTVFITPDSGNAPGHSFVLAPPRLLEQLHALVGLPAAVLLKADYTGKVVEGAAEFDAAFQAYSFSDEATLTLPLDGVQLTGAVLVDGAPVQATALPASQRRFHDSTERPFQSRRAAHKVELHFRTPVTGAAGERNLQFTVPRLAQSHLLLRLPKGSAYIQALVKYGVQKSAADGDPFSLDVELGRVAAPLHFRWVAEKQGEAARPPELKLKEAYLWDLRLDSSSLTAFLAYTISPEGTASLGVRVPPELEVLAVAARRPRDSTPLRLRDWRVGGAGPAPRSPNRVCLSGERRAGSAT